MILLSLGFFYGKGLIRFRTWCFDRLLVVYVLSMLDQSSEIQWVGVTVVRGGLIFGLGGVSIADIGC